MFKTMFRCLVPAALMALAGIPAIAQTAPTIDGFDPVAAPPGSVVRLDVSAVGAPTGGAGYEVLFNGEPGTILEPGILADASDPLGQVVALWVVVPPAATTGPITLRIPDPADPAAVLDVLSASDFEVVALAQTAAESVSGNLPRHFDDRVAMRLARRLERGSGFLRRLGPGGVFGSLFGQVQEQLLQEIRAHNAVGTEASTGGPRLLFRRLGPANFVSEIADSKSVVIADFDGDGNEDAFVPQTSCLGCPDADTMYRNDGNDSVNNPTLTVLEGQVVGDVTPKRQFGTATGDLDGDGAADVVPSGFAPLGDPSRVRMLINDGTGLFADEVAARVTNVADLLGPEFDWQAVDFGDLDGDGDLDAAIANRGADQASALLIDEGPAMPGTYTAYPGGFGEPVEEVHRDVLLCDLTSDGLAEVVLSQDITAPMAPLRLGFNAGGTPPVFDDASAALLPNPAAHTVHLGCGDFDGDGLPDLHVGVVARSDRDPTLGGYREDLIYLNRSTDGNGNGTIDVTEIRLEAIASPEPGQVWGQGFDALTQSSGYGDFDGNGYLDILVGSVSPDPSARGPFVMLNEGDGTFTNVADVAGFWPDDSGTGFDHFNPAATAVGDLNADGHLDVVWAMGDLLDGSFDEANRVFLQEAPPTAMICADVMAECAGETTDVTLDGTCSSDPENGDLTYEWSSDTCTFADPTLPMPTASCPLGEHLISLVVTDPTGLSSDPDEAMVIIVDTTPPTIDASVSPDELWPPNHKLVPITATIDVADICDPNPSVTLLSVTSNEPDNGTGDGDTANDIQDASIGTDDRSILLRAERKGNGSGRIYTIVYGAADQSGNTAEDTALVTVPHDQGNRGSAANQAPAAGFAWRWIRLR